MEIKLAIENLYSTFSKYTKADMHYCDCGCIDPKDVLKLGSKPLRQLTEDDFCSYHGSALHTWGDLCHYKHYLPRILEVNHQMSNNGIIDLFDINMKMAHAEWTTWPEEEVDAILQFIRADWAYLVNEKTLRIDIDEFEQYGFYLDIVEMFKLWYVIRKDEALKNFVLFFYENGNKILSKGLWINEQDYTNELFKIIKGKHVIGRLENHFFEMEEIGETAYAAKISAVLQMIE